MPPEYVYPDIEDQITLALIKQNEPFEGYWEKSEKKVLNKVKEEIRKHISNRENSWLFDAGCGTGRLLPVFQSYFGHILAIDPDPNQIEKANKFVKDLGLEKKVELKTTSIEQLEWKEESIDAILNSHIIQHVPTESVSKILTKFHQLLCPSGLLFIMTTRSAKNNDYYAKGYLRDSKSIEEEIDESEFNSLIQNKSNILPIHFFSMRNIQELLKKSGFKTIKIIPYHFLGKTTLRERIMDRNDIADSIELSERKYGRDMLVIGKEMS